jgi:hypothetical protein
MANIDWNDGRLITLTPGDTATAEGALNARQLYGLFFYNSAQNQADAQVTVVWSGSHPPATVVVPGTTANQGLASVLFVSGNDTNTVSAALLQGQPGVQVQCFIGSVKMPTNTAGMNNLQLPADGQMHPFDKFTRYYTVPQSHWYAAMLQSNINQFISVQFAEQAAKVYVVNKTSDPSLHVQAVGQASRQYEIEATSFQSISWNLQGDGTQVVWINADSVQNSESAAGISLQSLSGMYEVHAAAARRR